MLKKLGLDRPKHYAVWADPPGYKTKAFLERRARLMYASRPMTVCIAALADLGKSLVMACDSRLSTEKVFGDKAAQKMFPLSNEFQWWAMFAGDDITQIPILYNAMLHSLFRVSDATNTAEFVSRCAMEAYRFVRLRRAVDLVLSPTGFTLQQFLPLRDRHPDLSERMDAVELGCGAIVAGFDFAGDGFIFSVEHPGEISSHDFAGWASIGSGESYVTEMLLRRSVNCEMELPYVLYHTCEAKFMAEQDRNVGRHTVVKVAHATGKMDAYVLSDGLIDNIRTASAGRGRSPVSDFVIDHLRSDLKKRPNLNQGD